MNETVYCRAFEPDLYSPKWTRSAPSNALRLNCGRTIVSDRVLSVLPLPLSLL